ncbi:MAG: amino acid ABC transporter permease [Defluviitaleaceae bacterium]|nr:amino acid ABC transporter permease [Defluviitaleaceae bacterium]
MYQNLLHANRWHQLIDGLSITLQVTILATLLGVMLGFILALMRISKFAPARWFSSAYITVIRGTPLLVQLLIWRQVILPGREIPLLLVGVLAYAVNSSAYVCEIMRGGILSVDKGQTEAGRSVGLSKFNNMRLIVLPQAFKNALPSLSNEFITVFKETSVLGMIAMTDLTRAATLIVSRTFDAFVPFITIALMYLSIVMLLTWLLGKLERRLRKGDSHTEIKQGFWRTRRAKFSR